MRFRLLTFADPCGGTCVFCLRAAASVERACSGCSRARNFELPAPSQFSVHHAFNSNFRIRRNVHFSRHDLRPLQQLGISFIDCGISFVRIADFFYILYRSLKKLQSLRLRPYLSSTTYPPLPILHYLSSTTYPPLPILHYLSSTTYPPKPIL